MEELGTKIYPAVTQSEDKTEVGKNSHIASKDWLILYFASNLRRNVYQDFDSHDIIAFV